MQATASLGALGQRLQKQEEDFAGKAASYQREIQHLQKLLRDKQDALDALLQQKREVEGELEVVWQTAVYENQTIRRSLCQLSPSRGRYSLAESPELFPGWPPELHQEDLATTPHLRPESSSPPPFASRQSLYSSTPRPQQSPTSNLDHHRDDSSDEGDDSKKKGLDFYS